MGHGAERHDLHQPRDARGAVDRLPPAGRCASRWSALGQTVEFTYEANPGEVWEEDEFWIELSWRIDPDGSLGIRKYYESPYRPGEKITVDEYYRWIFENSVPGPARGGREAEGLTPLEYMRRYGAFEVSRDEYGKHEAEVDDLDGTQSAAPRTPSPSACPTAAHLPLDRPPGRRSASMVDGVAAQGLPHAVAQARALLADARRLGLAASTRRPAYSRATCTTRRSTSQQGEYVLLPTFRLPTLIHTRSGNAKWLNELSHTNPLLVYPEDAERIGVATATSCAWRPRSATS